MKSANLEFGRYGEKLAMRYLKQKGYRILNHHWTCRWGEIDIVASKDEKLVFCEVKTRTTNVLESFHRPQQKRLWRSIQFYLSRSCLDRAFQVDFIGVEFGNNVPKITHLQNVLEDLD